jgi:hypothetical protein
MEIGILKRESFEVWTPFDEDTEVLIAYQSKAALGAIRKQATTSKWGKNHQLSEECDNDEANRLLGRAAVRDWRALPGKKGFTLHGESYPYTPENCDFLMEQFTDFSNFVNVTCVDLQRLVAAEEEQSRKNSSSTSGRGSTSLV